MEVLDEQGGGDCIHWSYWELHLLGLLKLLNLLEAQGYLAQKKTPTPLGLSQDPRHRPTVGSWGGAFSCQRGNPVLELFETLYLLELSELVELLELLEILFY